MDKNILMQFRKQQVILTHLNNSINTFQMLMVENNTFKDKFYHMIKDFKLKNILRSLENCSLNETLNNSREITKNLIPTEIFFSFPNSQKQFHEKEHRKIKAKDKK